MQLKRSENNNVRKDYAYMYYEGINTKYADK